MQCYENLNLTSKLELLTLKNVQIREQYVLQHASCGIHQILHNFSGCWERWGSTHWTASVGIPKVWPHQHHQEKQRPQGTCNIAAQYYLSCITKQVGTSLTTELHLVCNPANNWLFWHTCFVWNSKYQSVNSFKNGCFKITRYITAEAWKSMHDHLAYSSLEPDCGVFFTEVLLIWHAKVKLLLWIGMKGKLQIL
jgi:hypothetical protein